LNITRQSGNLKPVGGSWMRRLISERNDKPRPFSYVALLEWMRNSKRDDRQMNQTSSQFMFVGCLENAYVGVLRRFRTCFSSIHLWRGHICVVFALLDGIKHQAGAWLLRRMIFLVRLRRVGMRSTKEEMYSSEGCGGGFCSTSEVASLNLFQLKSTGARVGSNKVRILLNPTRFIDDDFCHPLGLGWNLQACFRWFREEQRAYASRTR
jgi:hypothetical protein